MSKMTFKYTASFDLTAVLDVAQAEDAIAAMRAEMLNPDVTLQPVERALYGLVLQAYDRTPEQGYAELLRTAFRVDVNELVRGEFARSDATVTLRPSPVKVVCHGIEI